MSRYEAIVPIGDKAEEAVPLTNAAEILSEELSDEVKFEAWDAALVYAQRITEEKGIR